MAFNCLNEMFKTRYAGITWYCHNSGKYDSRILIYLLYRYNELIEDKNNNILKCNNFIADYNKLVMKHNLILGIEESSKDISKYNDKVYKHNKKLSNEMKELPIDERDVYLAKSLIPMKVVDSSTLLEIKTTFKDTIGLKLVITKTVGKTKHSITMCDSCAILPDSLKRLAIKYDLPTLKGDFPHKFVNENTVFYIGNTPDNRRIWRCWTEGL